MLWWTITWQVGCVAVEPSGQPFRAVRAAVAPAPELADAPEPTDEPEPEPEPSGPQGDFDFQAADRPADEGIASDVAQSALSAVTAPLPDAALPVDPSPAPPSGAADAPVWDPSKPLADVSFGIRVIATLLDLQPPRAVLGLPDGEERVVRPGTMLEDHGLVVLAIGRDAVQIAKITPQGFHASVTTETVRALYPAPPAAAP